VIKYIYHLLCVLIVTADTKKSGGLIEPGKTPFSRYRRGRLLHSEFVNDENDDDQTGRMKIQDVKMRDMKLQDLKMNAGYKDAEDFKSWGRPDISAYGRSDEETTVNCADCHLTTDH